METYVENFETVVAKQPIVRILDPSSIEFVISVPESMIALVRYVEKIHVVFDAIPGVKVPAKIKEVGKEATQATRTYPVTLVMAQPRGIEIFPGMAGSASIMSRLPGDHAGVGIEIPATAVFPGQGKKSYVWIVDEVSTTLSRREVEIGRLSRSGMRVTAGLTPGEWIVIKGVNSLSEGEEVRIFDASKDRAGS